MDWLPLLSTLTGATIGIVATLIADRNRWKREDVKEALRLRLDVYTQYTTTVKVLGETLRALAEREHPSDDERALALREAFRDSGIAIASERMWLIAPQPVVKASNSVFHRQAVRSWARPVPSGGGLCPRVRALEFAFEAATISGTART